MNPDVNPIESAELRDFIQLKFRSVRRFCDIVDTSYISFRQGLFQSRREFIDTWTDVALRCNDRTLPDEITENERIMISNWINDTLGSVHVLCNRFSRLNKASVYDILKGKTVKKNKTYLRICEIKNKLDHEH